MKRVLQISGISAGGLLIGLIIIAVFAVDPMVRSSIARITSDALKVPAKLDSARLEFKGRLTLDGLDVANPTGFNEHSAIKVGHGEVAVPFGSIFGDEFVISEASIERPELTIEFIGAKSNLSTLMDNLSGGKTAEGSSSTKRFRIAHFKLVDAKVNLKSDLLAGGAQSFVLPPIELQDIGGKSGWATAEEVLALLLHRLAADAVENGKGFLPAELVRNLDVDLKAAASKFEPLKKGIDKVIKELPDPFKKK